MRKKRVSKRTWIFATITGFAFMANPWMGCGWLVTTIISRLADNKDFTGEDAVQFLKDLPSDVKKDLIAICTRKKSSE